MKVVPKQPTLS